MANQKSPQRTMRWARVCVFVEREAQSVTHNLQFRHAKANADRNELVEYCTESRNKAAAEGYDDTATYLQHDR